MNERSRLTPHASRLTIRDVADGALLVEYPGLSDEQANARAVADARALQRRSPAGLLDAVVGARTLYLEFDPAQTSGERLAPSLQEPSCEQAAAPGHTHRIPVAYGGEAGKDLPELAQAAGLSPEEFARRHAFASHRVAFLGFAPGFAYLTGLPPELHAPRLPTPRPRVAAGVVAIAGPYTGIYPGDTPGGWRIIGRTSVRLFDPHADPPALFSPGDSVLFDRVGEEQLLQSSAFALRASADKPDRPIGSPLLRVVSPGVFSSVQGAPRYGWSRYGVPPGGAMDPESLTRGNRSLGNPERAPALEMTFVGAELEAIAEATACLAGASPEVAHNGRAGAVGQPFRLRAGDRLRIARILEGARSYLCVEGGLAMSDRPGLSPRLEKGDILCSSPRVPVSASPRPPFYDSSRKQAAETVVRVVLGPHRERFPEDAIALFLSSLYRVSTSSDRRGVRLEGPPIGLSGLPDIPPEGTPLGGIQVARDGMPIVLGPDRPITGGYARIATVIRPDFPLLAQAAPDSAVRFQEVALAEALGARVG